MVVPQKRDEAQEPACDWCHGKACCAVQMGSYSLGECDAGSVRRGDALGRSHDIERPPEKLRFRWRACRRFATQELDFTSSLERECDVNEPHLSRNHMILDGPWAHLSRSTLLKQLSVYFAVVFVVPWGIAAVLLAQPRFLVSRFGAVDVATPFYSWVFFAAVWTPSVAGFVLTWRYTGRQGLRELWGRVVLWRVGIMGLFVIVGIPAFYLITDWLLYAVFAWPYGSPHYHLHLVGWLVALFGGAIFSDPGPLGEEVGWRGFAFPRLMSLLPFWKAELVLGIFWGIWHVPAFFIASTGQSTLNMAWFIAGAVALSFLMGSVFVSTRGSVLYSGFAVHYFANQLPDLQNNIQIEVLRFAVLAVLSTIVGRQLGRTGGSGWQPARAMPAS